MPREQPPRKGKAMSLRVNTNTMAFNAYRNLSATDTSMGKSLEKLSSGLRINRAGDDASGLVISENLRSQVGGLKQAVRNAQDGISVVQTAEGALTEVHSMLQRMRDLAVQAAHTGANGTGDAGAQGKATAAAQEEVDALGKAINDIMDNTKFNGQAILKGTSELSFQVGADQGQSFKVSAANLDDAAGALKAVTTTFNSSASTG